MKKLQISVVIATLLALLVPSVVFASYNVYYCSYDANGFEDGSYDYPWSCENDAEFDDIVDYICTEGGGVLYEIVSGGYYRHMIEWDGRSCEITESDFYYGYPPDTGITLPPPLLMSAALALGLSLFAVGLVIYRKRLAN
jgi:hypothetical protein